jgi:LytS/YehU family sensor histidine kinase
LIAPLILITFIENAFKYGVNPNQDSDIAIYIRLEEAFISMEVNNKIVVIEKGDESMGIGLTNTKNRLRLLYPGKHTLDINASDHFYSVTLLIQLL